MPKIPKTMRRRVGAKKLDLSDLRHVLRDRRAWAGMGLVIEPEDGEPHFEIVVEDGNIVDILIEVEIVPERIHVTARLSGSGGQNTGLWQIPQIGDEVAVLIPDGEVDFCPIIVGVLSGGQIPNGGGQGPDQTTTVIVNSKVLVHDGAGGAAPLPTKAEFDAHTHPTGVGPSGVPSNAPITGTTVLEAK